jgi:hypothetical protein
LTTYSERWHAISARMRGLAAAAQLHTSLLQVRESDSYGRGNFLSQQCAEILSDLQRFVDEYQLSLPVAAVAAVKTFVGRYQGLFKEANEGADIKAERGRAVLVLLVALETQISFLLSDNQPAIRARFELAMAHLQRSIAVDDDLRSKWQKAFEKGEPECERLGAVHLLSHSIWAFKVQANKAITDLVFPDRTESIPGYVTGFVLTEWKKATPDRLDRAFEEARRQVGEYSAGALGGAELIGYRYVLLVVEKQCTAPADVTTGQITYKAVVLAVNPMTPSQLARTKNVT